MFIDGMPAWKKGAHPLVSTPSGLNEYIDKGTPHILVDVRSADAAAKEHIKGAVSIPLGGMSRAKDMFPADKKAPVIIYADTKELSEKAFSVVRKWGYGNASYLEGGIEAWKKAGHPTLSNALKETIAYVPKPAQGEISFDEFKKIADTLPGDKFILDVRDKDETAEGMLKNAKNIPAQDVEAQLKEIPKDKEIIIHCSTGTRAEIAYNALKDAGYRARFLNAEVEITKDGSYKISKG